MAKLIEPWVASAVARRFTGDSALQGSYLMDRLRRDLSSAVPRSEELVAEVSGILTPPPVTWGIIDRGRWADANVRGIARMLAPLADKVSGRLDAIPFPLRIAQRTVLSAEIGLLLGYVSRRVLGQYDLLVPEDDASDDATLLFVGPNMVETERRFGFVPHEFALWVAVHEVTHRFQFEGVPWLRDHFLGLVHDYLRSIDLDAKGFAQRIAGAARRFRSSGLPAEERNPVYLLASDDQRVLLDRIQALMAVVEGHGNYVMDTVGQAHIPTFNQMRHVFQRRRNQTTMVQRVINQAIGLEMKMRQYEMGQSFCEAVVAREGADSLRYLWIDPDSFPTMAELKEPERWLRRVAA